MYIYIFIPKKSNFNNVLKCSCVQKKKKVQMYTLYRIKSKFINLHRALITIKTKNKKKTKIKN